MMKTAVVTGFPGQDACSVLINKTFAGMMKR